MGWEWGEGRGEGGIAGREREGEGGPLVWLTSGMDTKARYLGLKYCNLPFGSGLFIRKLGLI